MVMFLLKQQVGKSNRNFSDQHTWGMSTDSKQVDLDIHRSGPSPKVSDGVPMVAVVESETSTAESIPSWMQKLRTP
jgi:hypothetical protein